MCRLYLILLVKKYCGRVQLVGLAIDQCPVDIEHIDHFIGIYVGTMVLMESTFPTQLKNVLKA